METKEFKKCCANCEHLGRETAITNLKPYCYSIPGFVSIYDINTMKCKNWKKRKGEDFKLYG